MRHAALANRPFWKRSAVVCSGVWVGGTILYSMLDLDPSFTLGLHNYDSDTGMWFAVVGAILVFITCRSVPWIFSGSRFWRNLALVGAGLWVGGTVLYSLQQGKVMMLTQVALLTMSLLIFWTTISV